MISTAERFTAINEKGSDVAGALFVVLFAQVVLTNVAGFVPGRLQQAREAGKFGGVLGEVIRDSVSVRVQPTKNRRSAGRAKRRRAESVLEEATLASEPVNVWRLQMRLTGDDE